MNFRIQTRYNEMCLKVVVKVNTPTKVTIKIVDEEKSKIIFTDRYKTIQNTETFYIRMPLTSNSVILSVQDENRGNVPKEQEKNIQVVSIDKTPLEKRMDVVDIKNKNVAYFVDFAQRFCYNASYLATNKSYKSDNGQFIIEYLPTIISTSGKELTTPARISS